MPPAYGPPAFGTGGRLAGVGQGTVKLVAGPPCTAAGYAAGGSPAGTTKVALNESAGNRRGTVCASPGIPTVTGSRTRGPRLRFHPCRTSERGTTIPLTRTSAPGAAQNGVTTTASAGSSAKTSTVVVAGSESVVPLFTTRVTVYLPGEA